MTNYDLLISKLDGFIRKYYKGRLIKGALITFSLVLSFVLLTSVTEYFLWLGTTMRTLLFVLICISFASITGFYIVVPCIKLLGFGKRISHSDASKIIGKHFREVEDRLFNILELRDQASQSDALKKEFIHASINQKAENLSPVPFSNAINLSDSWKYLRFALPAALVFITVYVVNSNIFSESATRIVQFNKEFVPPAPFSFSLVNNHSLSPVQGEELTLRVAVSGEYIPQYIYMETPEGKALMTGDLSEQGQFYYRISSVSKDFDFRFTADGFYSETYAVNVLARPFIEEITVLAEFPEYLKMSDVKNPSGDITVPEGTALSWQIRGTNVDRFSFAAPSILNDPIPFDERISSPVTSKQSFDYAIISENQSSNIIDTAWFKVNVIPDQYPNINLAQKQDSVFDHILYFSGNIQDDYGFTDLHFYYKKAETDNWQKQKIQIDRSLISSTFYHIFDARQFGFNPGEQVSYYFEVRDNDGVNGPKPSKSSTATLFLSTQKELQQELKEEAKDIEKEMSDVLDETRKLKDEFDQLKKDLVQKKTPEWQDKKKMEDLVKDYKNLEQRIDKINEMQEINSFKDNEVNDRSEEILQKQQELDKLFEELISDEMREMMREMERLMNQEENADFLEELEKMDLSAEELEKELDRSLELFKKLELEKEMQDIVDELSELSKKQEELSEDKVSDSEEFAKKQEQLNEEFDKLSEKLNELEKKNETLENPMEMSDTDEQEKSIQQEMNDALQNSQQNKKKSAKKNQKNAAQKMGEMAQQMQAMMEQSAQEQAGEDMEALRALLENIITLSFDQEQLLTDVKQTNSNDPRYTTLGQRQTKLMDDMKVVEDSLTALSKRVSQISPIVHRELLSINSNMDRSLYDLTEHRIGSAITEQHYVMTSLNNLALLLDEALKQMQQQMANSKPGSKSNCNKPGAGGGKSSSQMKGMKKLQEQLAKELEEMKKGQKKGGKKPGSKDGKNGMPMQFAKMAAKQAAIRRKLNQMAEELNKDGKGSGNKLREIAKDMEKTEEDLVNKRLNTEMLKRQQEILTRMLEAENAEKERERSPERKSNTAKQYPKSSPDIYFEYEKRKLEEIQLLQSLPPELNTYYKQKVAAYMNQRR